MKNYLIALSVCTLVACSSTPEKKAPTEKPSQKAALNCIYSFDKAATTFNWLAYKLTDRIGVPGIVDSASVSGMNASSNIQEVFANAKVSLFIPSLDSKNAIRDKKIVDIFFGAMTNNEVITGSVLSVAGNNKKGTGAIQLAINNVEQEVPFEYELEDTRLKLKYVVDFNNFQAQTSIADLNKACDERHKGKDGKSILWPDVKITIISKLIKMCD
ncbi:MAG: hypothetical protein ACJAUV_000595 [Flavobacteriales bacterium]|jgi:hypothetical protein